jgi:uncharacterized protein
MPEITPSASARAGRPRGAAANPYVFDLRELGRRPGALREYSRCAPASDGLGADVIGVPAGAQLTLDMRLETVTEGVLVTGTVTAPLTGQCARCLDALTDELVVDVCELFAYPESATDTTTQLDEVFRVHGDLLDIEPAVRDAVVLALPWTPLCRADCAGLCPECGQRRDELPPDHTHELLDPRWAALAAFRSPNNQESE